jgi:hypothetical protein
MFIYISIFLIFYLKYLIFHHIYMCLYFINFIHKFNSYKFILFEDINYMSNPFIFNPMFQSQYFMNTALQ